MMSDLHTADEECPSGVDIEERGNSLRVASNTPHLISLGCGRLSTAVTIHPLKQGGIILGSDNSCGVHLEGTGVQPIHCKIENSNGVITIYPLTGITTLDGEKVEEPTRLSQGCTIGIGRSNYLRFNHPEEANLMKSVLPNTRISMAPIQFLQKNNFDESQHQISNNQDQKNELNSSKEHDKYERLKNSLTNPLLNKAQEALDNELEMIGENTKRKKPPIAPRRMFRDLDQISNSSNSDQEIVSMHQCDSTPKTGSIMSKVSKFEFYVKNSQRNVHKNTSSNDTWSPKVFSANSATGNIAAKDVLIGKNAPSNYVNKDSHYQSLNDREKTNGNSYSAQRIIMLNENRAVEARNCSYSNVMIKSQVEKIDQISRTFDGNRSIQPMNGQNSNRPNFKIQTPSPSFNRNPVFNSPTSQGNFQYDNSIDYKKNLEKQPDLLNDEDQKSIEQARIDEILSLCAEYEKQNSTVVPTTPTEKKSHNKIITNGSLPRSYQHNPNIIPSSDGYYRFDTGKHRVASPPCQMNSPNHMQNFTFANQKMSPADPNTIFNYNSTNISPQHAYQPTNEMSPTISSPISGTPTELFPQNTRQFPITELSSPLMIRKVARNAQNSSNYIPKYEQSGNPNLYPSNSSNGNLRNGISPYENVMIHNQNVIINAGSPTNPYVPRSPNTSSPRTRIKTTYANKNAPQPQHFVFPTPPPTTSTQHPLSKKSPGIEKQLSLTEDIPMIDDTEFANELEMRIARLNPENREKSIEKQNDIILAPIENMPGIARRNFEEIKRDLIADIPELDAIQEDLDRNLAKIPNTKNIILDNCADPKLTTSQNLSPSVKADEHRKDYNLFITKEHFNKDTKDDSQKINETISAPALFNDNHVDNINSITIECGITNKIPSEDKVMERGQQEVSMEYQITEIINVEPHSISNNESLETNSIEIKPDSLDALDVSLREAVTPEKNNEIKNINNLESLYCRRKNIMNDMKEIKTEINDLELSRKQSQLELDEFENRLEKLQDGLQVQRDIRKDEVAMVTVSDSEKLSFKSSQEERQKEMKEMLKKLEQADEQVKRLEKQFSKGRATLEELRHAQELLENEKKVYEDMEFQHLEKESEFYSRIAKEQNVLKNDPFGTCKKIEKMEKLIDELNFEMDLSEDQIIERDDNPHIKQLLDKLSELEGELCAVNEEINQIKKEVGIYRKTEATFNFENHKARIKSGDFSPPTSDDDDMNEIKDRIKSSEDRNSFIETQNPIFSKPEQNTSIENTNELRDLENGEVNVEINLNKKVHPIDPMSMSMIVETKSSLQDIFDDSLLSENSEITHKKQHVENSEFEKEKKGFWERNFDSLTRLKNKDKKKNVDIMSQSLNENMFYNNEFIESEFGSFEKCNSTKGSNSTKSKDTKNKSEESSKSKIASFSSLSKIMRRDSLGKKNKEKNNLSDKENVDINVESPENNEEPSKEKGTKHRYLKNAKTVTTDNKYSNKSKNNSNSSSEAKLKDLTLSDTIDRENSLPIPDAKSKIFFRKSAGDEIKKTYKGLEENSIQNAKIPSQDDIDRISKVTLDAPLFSGNGDMNTLGRKTLDSLRELERNRVALLEQKGCEVIENEREKMTELKKRVQNETLLKWEENQLKSAKNEANLIANEIYVRNTDEIFRKNSNSEQNESNSSNVYGIDFDSSCTGDDSALDSSSFNKHLRNSQSDSYNSSAYIEDDRSGSRNDPQSSPLANAGNNGIRPLSEMSDMSSDNGASPQPLMEGPRRSRKTSSNSLNSSFIKNRDDIQRPLTRYLPIDKEDLNLRQHIESAGHQVDLCPHVSIDFTSCRGYLHKLGAKFHGWSKRWFVFDRSQRALVYYSDKSEKKPRGGAYFQVIEEVYLDHLNDSRSPSPLTTFVVKTRQRRYYLMAPSGPAARIWIDVIFTGAQGYTEYLQ